jgi:hypothetical protein
VTSSTGQFQAVFPDGLVIDRLPMGYANERWHISFVCSGVDFAANVPSRASTFPEEFRSRVSIVPVDGALEYAGGGGHGSRFEQDRHLRFRADGVHSVEVVYSFEGEQVAIETVVLQPV